MMVLCTDVYVHMYVGEMHKVVTVPCVFDYGRAGVIETVSQVL